MFAKKQAGRSVVAEERPSQSHHVQSHVSLGTFKVGWRRARTKRHIQEDQRSVLASSLSPSG